MVGWQLCSNTSYPFPAAGFSLPPPGPVDLSLRLLKLDRGLHHYLLEAAYSWLAQVDPKGLCCDLFVPSHRGLRACVLTNLFLLSERHLAAQRGLHPPPAGHTSVHHPQGHVSGLELQPSKAAAEDHPSSENHPCTRSILKEHHHNTFRLDLKAEHFAVVFPGQLVQERNIKSGKVELMIDGVHYYVLVSN